MIIIKIKEFLKVYKIFDNNNMRKTIVGITCDIKGKFYESEILYSKKVISAGGIPFYLPMTTEKKNIYKIVSALDSILITGSRDIDPLFYGEKKTKHINPLDKNRTISELLYIMSGIKLKKKILGICGGMQLINVALGGNLHQDINSCLPSAIEHTNGVKHKISISDDSLLSKLFNASESNVNSYHHQSINVLAKSLRVSAITSDGIIEAFEDKKRKVIGVQWHPELSRKKQDLEFFYWLTNQNKY